MSEESSAEELLARAERQGAVAVSELYDRYAPRVFGLLIHILSSRDTADEVLRDVFYRLWLESKTVVEGGASVAAWLVLTAREAALERVRDERRNRPRCIRGEPAGHADAREMTHFPASGGAMALPVSGRTVRLHPNAKGGTPKGAAISAAWMPRPDGIRLVDERLAMLHKVINQLPKGQRRSLELAVFGGLGEVDIAREIGEPLGKARTGLRAAVTFVKHRRRAILGTWTANI